MFQIFHHTECINNHHQCIIQVIWCLKLTNHPKPIHLPTCITCPTCQTCIIQTMVKNNAHQQMSTNFFNQFSKNLQLKDKYKILIWRKNQLKHQIIMIKMPLILSAKCLDMINNPRIIKKTNKEKLLGVDFLPGKDFIESKLMDMQNQKNLKIMSSALIMLLT